MVYDCAECRGVAVALPVLRKHCGEATADTAWKIALQHSSHAGDPVPCPVCRKAASRLVLPEPRVELDLCRTCHFLWLDAGEMELLPKRPLEGRRSAAALPALDRRAVAAPDGWTTIDPWRLVDLALDAVRYLSLDP